MASTSRNLYRVCLAGLSGVGKTSIFNHIRGKEFSTSPTAELDFCNVFCDVKVDGGPPVKVTLQVRDFAEQEYPRTVAGTNAVIIVFSVDCPESFQEVDSEVERITYMNFPPDGLYFLVGNKVDLKREEVSQARIDEWLKSNRDVFCGYTRTSAKEGTNVRQLFDNIARTLVSRRVRPINEGAGFLSLDQAHEKRNCSLI